MSANVPQDLCQWLDSLGLQKRMVALNKNIVLGFVDGLVVAEVIAARFPRLVQLHNYSDTSSASGRMANWEILNRKVLSSINCELGDEDIERISNRQIQRAAIITFLRLLRAKLDTYAPTYQAEHQAIAAEQRARGKQLSMVSAKAKLENASEKGTADAPAPAKSAAPATSSAKSRRPSMAKSMQLLTVDKNTQELRTKARTMTDDEIEQAYLKVAATVKTKADATAAKVDEMARRSRDISEQMLALRTQNLDDMKKVDRRLGVMLNQLQLLETDPTSVAFMGSATGGGGDEGVLDENSNAKAFVGVSRRASALGMKLLDMLPEGAQAKSNKGMEKMEKEITRRSSMILQNRVGIKASAAATGPGSGDNAGSAAEIVSAVAGVRGSAGVVFNFATDEAVVEATHRRVYDAGTDRHFYVSARTGESSWAPPKDGIINCADEKSGRTFYTNVKTKKTAWRIEEVA